MKYSEVPFGSKTELRDYLKDYVKSAVSSSLLDEAAKRDILVHSPDFCDFLLGRYSELRFYVGESMHPEGALAFADGQRLLLIAAGLREERE